MFHHELLQVREHSAPGARMHIVLPGIIPPAAKTAHKVEAKPLHVHEHEISKGLRE